MGFSALRAPVNPDLSPSSASERDSIWEQPFPMFIHAALQTCLVIPTPSLGVAEPKVVAQHTGDSQSTFRSVSPTS